LSQAAAQLPSTPFESEEGGRLATFREFLDHNELELALDELELLGDHNRVPIAFWWYMHAAASEMKLLEHCERYDQRLGDTPTR
jgi:hypothetical protein